LPPLDDSEPADPDGARARSSSVADIQTRALVEKWGSAWAWGAEAGLSAGGNDVEYGLGIGGRIATGEPASLALSEWNAAARVQLTLPSLAGLCGSLGLGGSLLIVTPTSNVTAETPTLVGAGFVELGISRPFFFGSFGIAPGVGVRAFAAPRQVLLNEREVFVLPAGASVMSVDENIRVHELNAHATRRESTGSPQCSQIGCLLDAPEKTAFRHGSFLILLDQIPNGFLHKARHRLFARGCVNTQPSQ